jgi:hypothetical protein
MMSAVSRAAIDNTLECGLSPNRSSLGQAISCSVPDEDHPVEWGQPVRAGVTRVYEIDPLQDERWPQFPGRRHMAGLLHSTEWLDALRRTYGFRACAPTTSGPWERLANGLVSCRVQNQLTGRRLVSVPFSDHCSPLIDHEEELLPRKGSENGNPGKNRWTP